jgi:hypothetical protein
MRAHELGNYSDSGTAVREETEVEEKRFLGTADDKVKALTAATFSNDGFNDEFPHYVESDDH